MSNLRHPHTATSARRQPYRVVGGLCALIALASAARARAEQNPIEDWARSLESQPARYLGPTVPFPETPPRPALEGGVRMRSTDWPLEVHSAAGVSRARSQRVLRALEHAYAWASDQQWPLPAPDGGYGGDAAFDLYFAPGGALAADAGADVAIAWSELDAASTYALLDSGLPDAALERCALSALVQAGLLGHDPAEPPGIRLAGAAFATWLATGELGCDDARAEAQHLPALGAVGARDEQVASLALWLAMLSRRHDAGTGSFVRGVFELARKRSSDANALHAAPDFWQALAAALAKAGESLDASAEELAIERYFAADGARASPLPSLPPSARVPLLDAPGWNALPKHLPEREPGLLDYGSAYTRVDVRAAPAESRLHVWLRGDPGARWSLVAVRLDAHGRELARIAAPPRRVPQSYLPVELTPGTSEVLLVVTALPYRLPALDASDEPAPNYRLILSNTDR
jgi:hypothetical protein